jgi:hypothetical protein
MPRYHFNVYDASDTIDELGVELPNWASARREAVRSSGAILEDEAESLKLGEAWRMEVTDDAGLILFSLTFTVTTSSALAQAAAEA